MSAWQPYSTSDPEYDWPVSRFQLHEFETSFWIVENNAVREIEYIGVRVEFDAGGFSTTNHWHFPHTGQPTNDVEQYLTLYETADQAFASMERYPIP